MEKKKTIYTKKNLAGQRQSPRVQDIRDPKERMKYDTKQELSAAHRKRSFGNHSADSHTDALNWIHSDDPRDRQYRLSKKPKTTPTRHPGDSFKKDYNPDAAKLIKVVKTQVTPGKWESKDNHKEMSDIFKNHPVVTSKKPRAKETKVAGK